MLLTAMILAALQVPLGMHSGSILYTDLAGSSLVLGNRVLSNEPGSGRTTLSSDGRLFWKECPPGENQRIIRDDGVTVFEREYFSGPFESPSRRGFMVSVPGEILVMDSEGSTLSSFTTHEYPGSLASAENAIWFVSSMDGQLKKLSTSTAEMEPVPLNFTPLTVQHFSGLLLLERAEGGYSLLHSQGREICSIEQGFRARFTENGKIIFYRWVESDGCEAISWELIELDPATRRETSLSITPATYPVEPAPVEDPTAHFDVPYMHQRWDTPDWFNGSWSCGPTSCMMGVQYYNRLTPDSIWCSYPEGHWSQWGNYIPLEYTFLGYTYDILGLSPGSVWVPGSHGFICRDAGGAYWSYMVLWMEQHGLSSGYLGTSWGACTAELDSSWPVIASTTSIYTGGHILLFNGYYDNHSVICNDAYGNQNLPGWGNFYNGKDVVYDWPGYNNGNTELGISQLFSARSEVLAPAGTLIDDRTQGFRKLGPCQFWHEQTTGYGGYSWWTYSTGALPDTCVAEWVPILPEPGIYSVETWIPVSHSTATGIYHISTQSGWQTAYLNQNNYSGEWAELGSWSLDPGTAIVRMGDYTGTQGQYISFDAVSFTLETSVENENHSTGQSVFGPVSNPVYSSSVVSFTTPEDFSGEISIYDTSGREILRTQNEIQMEVLSPGIYFAVISNTGEVMTTRFTVID